MTKKKAIEIIELLKKAYPDAKCSLTFDTPFELAIAVMLSAQCTDERVNKTTPNLFSKYKSPKDFIKAPLSEIERIITPCGFHNTKSKNIKAMAQIVEEKFGGILPDNMEDLMSLPGIGRKSANVINLLKIIPKEYLKDVNHVFIWHGRKTCKAQSPNCDNCPVKDYCKSFNMN